MLEWIQNVWLPYVGGRPALLCLDKFSGHLTEAVKDALVKGGTKLLVIPGGCTSVLQPLDVSVNKPFKSFIRQSWCERMVREAETGAAKITPASKSMLMEWIKAAADRVEQHPTTIEKSFQVTGIVQKPDCTRSDTLYKEIQEVMTDVFGQEYMGYVEPTDDPFASSDSDVDPPTAPTHQPVIHQMSQTLLPTILTLITLSSSTQKLNSKWTIVMKQMKWTDFIDNISFTSLPHLCHHTSHNSHFFMYIVLREHS